MSTVSEMMEKFCWKSKTRSVWKNDPDLFDDAMARIHSEAAVFDAIIRSKNTTVPSLEKISRTVKFLEQNSFWRSNPFSLVSGTDDDPALARATSQLQMKSIRDLWGQKPNQKILTDSMAYTQNSSGQSTESSKNLTNTDSEKSRLICGDVTAKPSVTETAKQQNQPHAYVGSMNTKPAAKDSSSGHQLQAECETNSGTRTYAEAARGAAPFPA
ncbi:unnamed protein product [Calicophoron daubneyi]|uniref:Uncharacterized protein n=1 Tax=Calicophoron daubneyi TaxID=300641 RepID=A0AAV2T6W5_CALDB